MEGTKQIKEENKDNNKIRKVFLDELPRKGKFIDWIKSVGLEIQFIYDDIEGYVNIVGYENNYLEIEYNDIIDTIYIGNFKKGAIGKIIGKVTGEFKIKIGTHYKDEKRDITIIDRKKEIDDSGIERKYYKYDCNICGFECGEHYKNGKYKEDHWVSESSIIDGVSCACCCPTPRIIVSKINSIYQKAKWMIPIVGEKFALSHACYCEEYIKPVCPDCGRTRDKLVRVSHIYETHSMGCDSCGDGVKYPNKFAFKMLKELNVYFETEYSPNWIGLRRYDFYFKLNDKEYILEMDGGWHEKDNTKSGQTADQSKIIDDYKDKMAIEHGIRIVRIDCNYENKDRFNYIKNNILQNKILNELFNINQINWNKIEEYSLSNIAKIACDYKLNNIDLTTTEISNIMGYNSNTICSWLKQGTNVGWCYYDAVEEQRKNGIRLGKASGKQIKCKETGQIFESASECARQSLKLFGVKLYQANISKVLLGERISTSGFSFEFV